MNQEKIKDVCFDRRKNLQTEKYMKLIIEKIVDTYSQTFENADDFHRNRKGDV